jgi:hypothetical protein
MEYTSFYVKYVLRKQRLHFLQLVKTAAINVEA